MYLSEKPRALDFYKEGGDSDLVIEVPSNGDLPPPHHPQQNHPHHPDLQQLQQQQPQQQQMILADSSGGEDHEVKAPKKRAETWIQEETRSLISLRREVDRLFNISKSNKHLWELISAKMRERGFDRSPTMCTDKWRNLLKEFKKVKHHNQGRGNASAKMLCYKELEELLKDRAKINGLYKSPTSSKVDSYVHFSDKGLEDGNITFGSAEANGQTEVNLERPLDHSGEALAAADAIAASGVPSWNWRENPGNGECHSSYGGRIITVKWREYTRRIGIDGTADAIKEAIKSAFGLRSKRAFWLEDEENVIRSLDRDMPLGNYTLHVDGGISIKVCLYDHCDQLAVHSEDKTLYTEDDLRDFLAGRGLIGLREINDFRCLNNLDDLRPGAMYRGVRLLGE